MFNYRCEVTLLDRIIYIYRQKNKCKDLEAFVFRPSYPFRFPWSSFEQFIYVWKRRACSLLISSARVVGSVSDCLPKPISGPLSSAPSAKWLRVDHPCPPSPPPPACPSAGSFSQMDHSTPWPAAIASSQSGALSPCPPSVGCPQSRKNHRFSDE